MSTLASSPVLLSAGLDGCRAGWVCVGWDGSNWMAVVFATLQHSQAYIVSGARVCIDIPVGLSETGLRGCDREARRLLGPRRSSVLPRHRISHWRNAATLNLTKKVSAASAGVLASRRFICSPRLERRIAIFVLIARAVESGEKLTRSSVLLHCKVGCR